VKSWIKNRKSVLNVKNILEPKPIQPFFIHLTGTPSGNLGVGGGFLIPVFLRDPSQTSSPMLKGAPRFLLVVSHPNTEVIRLN
jgi:hypothetical protein